MRADDAAVAGFFEDLPVLLFVLAGVSTLVLSGVMAAERASEKRLHSELDSAAERLLDSILMSLGAGEDIGNAWISSVGSVNISRCSAQVLDGEACAVNFVQYWPSLQWLRSEAPSMGIPSTNTGYASRVLNAIEDNGLVGIIEVTVHVWHKEDR